MKQIIIAIDGFSSCGKSTLAKALAKSLDYLYIDSGAMYRAVTYYLLEHNVDLKDDAAVRKALDAIHIDFRKQNGQHRTILNGNDVEEPIRKMPVSRRVSQVAAISAVRRAMVAQQRKLGRQKGIVMDGRDIGTVVFSRAELKIFLTADKKERLRRRFAELQRKGLDIQPEDVRQNLEHRDKVDSTREDSPLKQAEDAVVIDNTNLSEAEQLAMVLALARKRIEADTEPEQNNTEQGPSHT